MARPTRSKRPATAVGPPTPRKKARGRYWSKHVMETSNALDLAQGVFTQDDPRAVAQSLKRSAEQSHRRKAHPFQSAMSMLNFEINRAGKNLSPARRAILERAKDELRIAFGRPPAREDPSYAIDARPCAERDGRPVSPRRAEPGR